MVWHALLVKPPVSHTVAVQLLCRDAAMYPVRDLMRTVGLAASKYTHADHYIIVASHILANNTITLVIIHVVLFAELTCSRSVMKISMIRNVDASDFELAFSAISPTPLECETVSRVGEDDTERLEE